MQGRDDEHMEYQEMKPGRGGLILAFGILSWVVCVIFGIAAWVMGNNDLSEMDAGRMDPRDRGLTQAGKIIGMISVLLVPIVLILIFIFIFGVGVMAASGTPGPTEIEQMPVPIRPR